MAPSLGIDGLASGLQTTEIINSLMQIESAPRALLVSKQSTAQSRVAALQGLNTRVASLATVSTKAADPASWTSFKATSTASHVSATTTTAAQSGSLTFSVDSVATRQVSLSAPVTDGSQLTADNPPTLTLKAADGTLTSVTAASNSLTDIVSAVNDGDLGITATTVRVADGTYRLQFTSQTTGTDGSFELYVGDEAAVNAATAPRLDASVANAAADAGITLWKGTAYEQSFTQSSNTFDDLMTGTSVTISKPTEAGETVTVGVEPDASGVAQLAKDLVGGIGIVISEIASRTATTTSTGTDGRTRVTGGILTGDSAVRSIQDQLVSAAIYPVDGKSPSTVGISITRAGAIEFDEAKFAEALEADPAGVAAFMQSIATRVEDVATSVSDPYEGTLTAKITSAESQVKDMGRQIESWDTRLEVRRSALQATYAQLEVTLSNLNSQASWLSGQLASLPSISSQ